jgi:hypothetical protein
MNFSEVRERFEALLQNENLEEIKQEAGDLTREFYNLLDRRPARTETEVEGEVDYTDDDHIEKIKDSVKIYRERLEKSRQDRENVEHDNYKKKKDVVDELTRLISEEENISKAYFRFNELKEVWRNIGNVPQEKQQDIQNEYSRLVELFHYNMNIYKELRENDLKKNIALKNDIITRIDALKDKTNMKETDTALKNLQREWDDTGAVPKENWEDFRVRYWAAVQEIQGKLKSHYEEKRQVQVQALDAKKALIEKAKGISKSHNSPKEWENATKQLIDLQNEWKTVGFAPKEDNETVWSDFRAVCDDFFAEKKAFYDSLKEKASGINAKKEELIAKIDALKDAPEFKETTNKIIALQEEWKKLGGTGLKSDNTLYMKFRSGCDHFFNRKKEFYATNDLRQAENLKKKEEFIASLPTFELSENPKENFDKLKGLGNTFKELGDVPFKDKDRIYKAFQDAMNDLWDRAKVAKGERDAEFFKDRLEIIKTGPNALNQIYRERDFIREKIKRTTEEIAQVENNLGFFAKSKGENPVLKEYQSKLENLKNDLDTWKGKLKILDKEQKQLTAPKS